MDRQLLARATEGTDAPTPGYIYVDLSKAATANPTACQDMATYLTRRLANKSNPNIKYKCCKVIAKLCEQVPRNQFRRCLAQDPSAVAAVKDATNFRGPMDPVQGDSRNEKVRSAAKEALDAVYAEAPTSETTAAPTYAGMSGSYGPSPHHGTPGGGPGGAGGYTMGTGRKMEGIGNPMFSDPRNDPRYNGTAPTTVREAVREAGEVVMGMIKDPLARGVDHQRHSGGMPGYGGGGSHYGAPPPGAAELSRQTGGQWTMASNRGPGAVTGGQDGEYYKSRDSSYQWAQKTSGVSAGSGNVGGSWANAAVSSVASRAREPAHSTPSITVSTTGTIGGGGGTAASDGTYEKNLIQELCPPGGMKPVPPAEKLASFSQCVASLNPDLICPALLDCIEDGQPWIKRAKALCVMETCIRSGAQSNGHNPYLVFFQTCQEEISPLAVHPRSAIKDPAKRVLQLMGVDIPSSSSAVSASRVQPPAAAPPAAAAPNLLDFGDDSAASAPASAPPPPPSEAPPPPPAETASVQSGSAGSMFGGMQMKGAGPVANGAPMTQPAPEAAVAPASANLLDFPSPAVPVTSGVNNGDIFSGMKVQQQNIQAPAADSSGGAPSSMFAQLSVKSENVADKEEPDSVPAVAGNGASAFGFINESSSQENHAPPAVPAPDNKQVFDPLKNETPQTAQRKMMQLSPEQMQAMAYQQMMMQQQMQLMQQAIARQQLGGAMQMASHHTPVYPNLGAGHPAMTSHLGNPASSGFSFVDRKPVKEDDKKFDFVKDAMQFESGKKK